MLQDFGAIQSKAFVAICITIFIADFGLGIITPLMPLYATSLGATGVWLGAIFSGFAASRAIFMPMVGRLSDALRRRKIFIEIGLICYGLTALGYIWSNTSLMLFLVRFLHGLGSGFAYLTAMAYAGDTAPKGKEGAYMGMYSLANFLGWGAGPLMGGVLMDAYGITTPFLVMGGISFASLILMQLTVPEIRFAVRHDRERISFKIILHDKVIRGLTVYNLVRATGSAAMYSFLPLFAASLGSTATEIGIMVSVQAVLMSVIQIPFGKLADKYNRIFLIITGSLGASLFMLLIPFSGSSVVLLAVLVAMGVAWALSLPAAMALLTERGRNYGMGSTMSTYTVALSIGMVIGPLIYGVSMDTLGLPSVFTLGGIIGFAGTLVFYLLGKKCQ